MYPRERSLVKKMKGRPFAIVGVNSDKDLAILRKILKQKNLTWPSFFDGGGTGGPIATKWGVRGWPTIFVLDAKGVIRYKNVRGKRMDSAIETLMKGMGDGQG
jgi:peroxiredoxin